MDKDKIIRELKKDGAEAFKDSIKLSQCAVKLYKGQVMMSWMKFKKNAKGCTDELESCFEDFEAEVGFKKCQ